MGRADNGAVAVAAGSPSGALTARPEVAWARHRMGIGWDQCRISNGKLFRCPRGHGPRSSSSRELVSRPRSTLPPWWRGEGSAALLDNTGGDGPGAVHGRRARRVDGEVVGDAVVDRRRIRLRDPPRHISLTIPWHCGFLDEMAVPMPEYRNGGTRATREREWDNDGKTTRAACPPECLIEREDKLSHATADETMKPVRLKTLHVLLSAAGLNVDLSTASPRAHGAEDSTSVKRSPWAAPAPDAPSLRPRKTKAMPTASTAPASGPAT